MADLKNKFDSIIFDLDGTLWNSTVSVANAWQAAANKVNYITEPITVARVQSITGMAYDAIFEKLFPDITTQQREEFKALAAKHEIDELNNKGGNLYPGVENTLQYLFGKYKLFIVSNCQSGYIETFLKMGGMANFFMGHQCYGTKSQPKWQNIIDVVNDYQLQTPIYVGDTMGDYDASIKAGVPFIFASYGFGQVEKNQAATIHNFAELENIL